MEIVNAIAKVRFNSASPRRVQLHKNSGVSYELLCMEPGQEISDTGPCAYYIIAGNGEMKAGGRTGEVSMGHLALSEAEESHTLINTSEQRLICMAVC